MAKRRFLMATANYTNRYPYIWCQDNHLPMPSQSQVFPTIFSTYRAIDCDPQGRFFAGVSSDSARYGYIWSFERNEAIEPVFPLAANTHYFARVSGDGKYILFGNNVPAQNYYRLIDTETWLDVPLQGGLPTGNCVTGAISADSRYVVLVQLASSSVSAVYLYDRVEETRTLLTFSSTGASYIDDIPGLNAQFSPDGKEFCVCLGYNINRYSVETKARIAVYSTSATDEIDQCCYSPDGSLFCAVNAYSTTSTSYSNISVYNTSTWKRITAVSIPANNLTCQGCVFSPDSTRLYVSLSNRTIRVYDTSNWSIVDTLGPLYNTPGLLCITPEVGGTISNELTTPVVDAMNQPVQRLVVARGRQVGQYSAAAPDSFPRGAEASIAMTDENGRYDLPIFYTNEPYMVTFYADNDAENSVTVDWVTAE